MLRHATTGVVVSTGDTSTTHAIMLLQPPSPDGRVRFRVRRLAAGTEFDIVSDEGQPGMTGELTQTARARQHYRLLTEVCTCNAVQPPGAKVAEAKGGGCLGAQARLPAASCTRCPAAPPLVRPYGVILIEPLVSALAPASFPPLPPLLPLPPAASLEEALLEPRLLDLAPFWRRCLGPAPNAHARAGKALFAELVQRLRDAGRGGDFKVDNVLQRRGRGPVARD